MILPKGYFECCAPEWPGAQQVGVSWLRFISKDSLSMMIADGVLTDHEEVEALRERVQELEEEIEELNAEEDAA